MIKTTAELKRIVEICVNAKISFDEDYSNLDLLTQYGEANLHPYCTIALYQPGDEYEITQAVATNGLDTVKMVFSPPIKTKLRMRSGGFINLYTPETSRTAVIAHLALFHKGCTYHKVLGVPDWFAENATND